MRLMWLGERPDDLKLTVPSRRCSSSRSECGRILPAPARIFRAGPRDLRRVRRAAGVRRGDLRLRPDRVDVRVRRLRLCARHDHLRQGLTSGYSPIGAMIASDRLFEPFNDGKTMFAHGYTFGGHPVSSAVALANLDIFEREGLNDHVKEMRAGVPRHAGEAVRPADRRRRPRRRLLLRHRTGQRQGHQGDLQRGGERRLLRGFLTPALFEAGPVLPRRRPRRPGRAVGSPADQRAEGVRRDLRHPARRAGRDRTDSLGHCQLRCIWTFS